VNRWVWCVAIGHILVVSLLVQISIKSFPLSVVSIFLNCGPILTVILGGIILASERITLGTVAKAAIAFVGVLLITLGAPATPENVSVSSGP